MTLAVLTVLITISLLLGSMFLAAGTARSARALRPQLSTARIYAQNGMEYCLAEILQDLSRPCSAGKRSSHDGSYEWKVISYEGPDSNADLYWVTIQAKARVGRHHIEMLNTYTIDPAVTPHRVVLIDSIENAQR